VTHIDGKKMLCYPKLLLNTS